MKPKTNIARRSVIRVALLAAALAGLQLAWAGPEDGTESTGVRESAGPASRPAAGGEESAGPASRPDLGRLVDALTGKDLGRNKHATCRTATTQGEYWLHIPTHYDPERRYPLVVALHGMKPYDTAYMTVQSWGKSADKYGYLVLAPVLSTSDSFDQFPLKKIGKEERADIAAVLACMDEVITDYSVDRSAVLLTSWSMGGYLAHYLATEHGNRFSAFAALQSNFASDVLAEDKAKRWAGKLPVFIFRGTADLPVFTKDTKDAVAWYTKLDFNVTVTEQKVSHERHPELAAEFFESVLAKQVRKIEISVTPPEPMPAPLAVNLWPAMSSRIGEVRTYIWDFGKLGGPSYQKSPNVLIRQPGAYPIRLTVVEKSGAKHTAETVLNIPAARVGPP